jgi:signal transduction histidine kinase
VETEKALPLETQNMLFRITQEALANTARHSRADQVEIALAFEADSLILTIRDNGQGFDPKQITAGVGTQSMRERAATLPQGTFTLESTPGHGTTVVVRCAA